MASVMADVRDHWLGAEECILEEEIIVRVVIELQSIGLAAKVLKLSATMVLKVMVVKKFPSVVTDDLKLAVIMEVLMVVILVIRGAPEVVKKGAQVERDSEIVVEGAAMILAVKAAKQAESLDMDPMVL